jgi:uncharacterized protein (UPF0332 family)
MPFEWSEFLEVARFLNEQSDPRFSNEAAMRCVVSRAYYAAFGTARQYACKVGHLAPDQRQVHTDLKNKLKNDGNKNAREAGKLLEQLKDWREDCDYEKQLTSNPQLLARSAIKQASQVITLLRPAL